MLCSLFGLSKLWFFVGCLMDVCLYFCMKWNYNIAFRFGNIRGRFRMNGLWRYFIVYMVKMGDYDLSVSILLIVVSVFLDVCLFKFKLSVRTFVFTSCRFVKERYWFNFFLLLLIVMMFYLWFVIYIVFCFVFDFMFKYVGCLLFLKVFILRSTFGNYFASFGDGC